ncbi:hypothetical protein Q5H91_13380 [Sphingomonas sp. KR1UV-12]|uniref:Flagellar FliJ protein n=1 Tax=Sphingomonas aurea TaxID=3063994 RepID=A0ABT9EMN3_9SPHN|nr:hypothetical protein [Sphingomonas sp. KR1UV-12]MDP1028210.1 hypothetical protein [Sphingomonas sp. KR1UV-12]
MQGKTLARIHRVRTAQLNLARADEARAAAALANETLMTQRIAALVEAVAPTPTATGAYAMAGTALFRERLNQSADAAAFRVQNAEQRSLRAAETSRAAHRDQSAVEKLMERARLDALYREARDLQNAPPQARKRHDPC